MAWYSSNGYEVFIPVSQSRIDFIAVKNNIQTKVQCKTVAKRRSGTTTYQVAVLLSTSGSYSPEEIDEFFVVGDGVAWRIPHALIAPRTTVMLGSNKPNYNPNHGLPINNWRVLI
jgi:hypothetical protein